MTNTKLYQIALSLILSVFFAHIAYAEDSFVGGVVSSTHAKNPEGRECTTKDNKPGFECGFIFSNVCVVPVPRLSEACYNSSKGLKINEDDYASEYSDFKQQYDAICQDKEASINKPGCTWIAKRLAETGKSKDFPKTIVSSQGENFPVKHAGITNKKSKAINKSESESCRNDYDESTHYTFPVPPFTLNKTDMECNATRNGHILDKIAKSGCDASAKQEGNHLITTHIRPAKGSLCIYGPSCFDFIIENIVKEKVENKSTFYSLRVLRPDPRVKPALLNIETLELRVENTQYGQKYFLMAPDEKDGTPIDILNAERSGLTKKYGTNSATEVLQDNCNLRNALIEAGFHNAAANSASDSGTSK